MPGIAPAPSRTIYQLEGNVQNLVVTWKEKTASGIVTNSSNISALPWSLTNDYPGEFITGGDYYWQSKAESYENRFLPYLKVETESSERIAYEITSPYEHLKGFANETFEIGWASDLGKL